MAVVKTFPNKNWIPLTSLEQHGISARTLRRWAKAGKITARKFGKKYFVNLKKLLIDNDFRDLAEEFLSGH